jgi:uncharacterized membrane protein
MKLQALMLFLHIASVTVWVGGMFFAYLCLRPAAAELLDPPQRLRLWRAVFARFFFWVWRAVALIALSGLIMFGQHGVLDSPKGWQLMMMSGSVMIILFVYVATGPFAALKRAVDGEDWKSGASALNRIRQVVGTNLLLGFVTIGFATLGYLG